MNDSTGSALSTFSGEVKQPGLVGTDATGTLRKLCLCMVSRRTFAKRLCGAVMLVMLPVCSAAKDSTETAGDILAYLMPVATIGTTYYLHDEEGRWQFGKAFVSSFGVTLGLKYTVDKERPDGSDNHSFPSGHSTVAFQTAQFIAKRYGWRYGLPAYVGAAYVGYSRVEAKKHYTSDVLAGAAIGILGSEYFTTRWEGLTVVPVTAGRGLMVSISKSF
jgi:membrane-associated phospholipid phosphatase